MIEEWLTDSKKEEIVAGKKNIIVAELTEIDGKVNIIGCTMGHEAILALLLATSIERVAETKNLSYSQMLERVNIAHAWSASQKAITDMVTKFEGGKKE